MSTGTDVITEKVYCTGQPQSNDAMTALLANGNMNGTWNNPFIYLVWMMFANRMWNNGENGENYNSRQIAALQDVVNTNHNNDLAMQAINGNKQAISDLAMSMNTSFGNVQQAVCGVRSAIEQVGGQIGYSSESVKNAIALGNNSIIQQMCNCCCTQKELIQRMGYENQLANCQQTNTLTNSIGDVRQAVVNGFANIGYQSEKNTSSILQGQAAQTQTILNALNNHWTQDLRDKLFDMSQQAQTASIVSQLKTT